MKFFSSATFAYPWTTSQGLSFRGYFLMDGKRYRELAAVEYLRSALSAQSPEQVFSALNGVFSVIWETGDRVVFAVDRLRGLPLFYALSGGTLLVGDDARGIACAMPEESVAQDAAEIYASTTLFVTGQDTLLNGLFQVQAGTFCVYQGNMVSEHTYYRLEPSELEDDPAVLKDAFHTAYKTVGQHLVQALDGRPAIVPLSGGADSRMVLSMLWEERYPQVLCFTYGRPGNREAEISRRLAAKYGYPWEMVPYDATLLNGLRTDPIVGDYCRFASACTSTPHLQDFPAVMMLQRTGKLPADAVFVPGHSGDMIAGSHITRDFLDQSMSRQAFLQTIAHKFFLKPLSPGAWQKVTAAFPERPPEDMEGLAAQSAWFNIQERQAKFIVNSVRVYEFFGYEWLIPLWDNVLFDFWSRVPLPLRYGRKLYFDAIGKETVASTNDATPQKAVASAVRRVPGVRTVARRGTRVMRYWRSSLQLERLFPLGAYLRGCLMGSELFDVNHLLCEQHLRDLRREVEASRRQG